MKFPSRSHRRPRTRQFRLWSIATHLTIATCAALTIATATAWLLWRSAGSPRIGTTSGSGPPARPLTITETFDLVKISLGVVAGVGGLVALVTAYRRQRVSEDAHRHAQEIEAEKIADAAERRVTELYTKAADQLGSEKAAVRLAGLYALERLGQGNPEHRQTIVSVLCAYLRMPYTPSLSEHPPAWAASEAETNHPNEENDEREEREVRIAAQQILARHLRYPQKSPSAPQHYWSDIEVDFTGATLLDFDFTDCRIETPIFYRATFSGETNFDGATFAKEALFTSARFRGNASFNAAHFSGSAMFSLTQFSRTGSFREAQFGPDDAWFTGTKFGHGAWFEKARFNGDATFAGTQFEGRALFNETEFLCTNVLFIKASEVSGGSFLAVEDTDGMPVVSTYDERIDFEGATISRSLNRSIHLPKGWTTEDDSTNDGVLRIVRRSNRRTAV